MEKDWKLIGYGLNIKLFGEASYNRVKCYPVGEEHIAIKEYNTIVNIIGLASHIDLEKIYSDGNDFDYEMLRTNEKWWEKVEDKRIDFIDDSGDGKDIAVFLKVGYLSPTTNCGFFHTTNKSAMFEQLDNLVHISQANEFQLRDYFEWVLDSAQPNKLFKEVKELFKGED